MSKLFGTTLISVLILVGSNSLAVAQYRLWRSVPRTTLKKFDWNCTDTSRRPTGTLNEIAQVALRRTDVGPPRYADRAFAFDLNGDRRPELFVPLSCGATGNCWWALLSTRPALLLGILNGEYLYVHRRQGRWPIIITYGHVTAAEGTLTTYRYHYRKYVAFPNDYAINHGEFDMQVQRGRGHRMPRFLERARKGCKNVDY
jgi:hypothetical protein